MPEEPKNGKGKWIAIVSTILSFAVGVIFAAYVLGQRTGKVLDLNEWKTETAPRIERMDAVGTNSFKFFHDEYLRTQARQEAMLIELQGEIHDKQMEDVKSRLLTLERK
jgi:flagellar basal body-associated protein FliL